MMYNAKQSSESSSLVLKRVLLHLAVADNLLDYSCCYLVIPFPYDKIVIYVFYHLCLIVSQV